MQRVIAGTGRALALRGARAPSRALADAAVASKVKLNFNFFLPHSAIKKAANVDMVIVPAASGLMGILPQHAPTVAQLRAGVVEVHDGGAKESFFVSSGFAFVHRDATDVCAVEAVPLDDVDHDAVKAGLADCEKRVVSASDPLEKAEAQIGVDVYMALNGALNMHAAAAK